MTFPHANRTYHLIPLFVDYYRVELDGQRVANVYRSGSEWRGVIGFERWTEGISEKATDQAGEAKRALEACVKRVLEHVGK